MDIMLERILSVIPRKEDGKFVHGALKQFANSIGLKSGNLVSDWMNGRSTSYESYIYQIADIYNVSADWLKGESDIKEKKPTPKDELTETQKKAWALIQKMDDDTLRRFIAAAEAMLG